MSRAEPSADELIRMLRLVPHPEGGYYRETYRDPAVSSSGRAASTAIYFLLRAGEVSRWHRVDAAEVWHWYAGATLSLEVADGYSSRHIVQLGPDIRTGQRPQAVVPAGHWQQARTLGAHTLVGCTVAPGYEFTGFEMALPDWQPPGRTTEL